MKVIKKKIIIAGSRTFKDYLAVVRYFTNDYIKFYPEQLEIVSGHANGADLLGERIAEDFGIALKTFPAEWEKHGKTAAGFIRNRRMAEYADEALVFWDGDSKGTENMIEEMLKRNKPVRVVRFSMLRNKQARTWTTSKRRSKLI